MNVLEQCAYRKLLKTTVNKFGYLEPLNNQFLYMPLDLRALVWDLRGVPMAMRLHAFTELAKHEGCGICVMYSEPLPGPL